jgi:ketosteroid isomerase-like protein
MTYRFAVLLFAVSLLRAAGPPVVIDIGATWGSDWSAKKLDHIMTLYATDAIFFTTDGARFAGAPAIRDFFQKTLAVNDPNIHMHRVASVRSGSLAYESGDYRETIVTGGHATDYQGNYLFVLRHQNGQWLIAEQMWTGSPSASK